MLNLWLGPGGKPRTVLCLGAHADDIEIGCGGTVLAWAQAHPDLQVHWLVLSAVGERAGEAAEAAAAFLEGTREPRVILETFPDGFMPFEGAAVKRRFESLKKEVSPDVILTHARGDRHQDHRLVAELTWNTFRDHLVLEYEIPKYEGDLGHPNLFVPLSREVADRKIDLLLRHFSSQRERSWFTRDVFASLLRLRGLEARSPSGLAEAFHAPKLSLRLSDPTGGAAPAESAR
jgi:LmbE family N-acetylglucosaminyl deacetylase